MASEALKYQIALTLVPGVGNVSAKTLLGYCGSAEAVFKLKKDSLIKIPDIGDATAKAIKGFTNFEEAEQEAQFTHKYKIKPLFFTDKDYPQRLKHCADAPVMLYYKGNAELNTARVISVVGTRKATPYGKLFCEALFKGLAAYDVLVVSGLAYGIDAAAHKCSLAEGLPTIAVLAHGLDTMYPAQHRGLAEKMLANGGLITEFKSKTALHPDLFPRRNRIVAGMADATIVIEAAESGGALITAEIANSYNRDVFALPGRNNDKYSKGCNALIKNNKAILAESAEDIVKAMFWDIETPGKKGGQIPLHLNLTGEESALVNLLSEHDALPIDLLSLQTNMAVSKTASLLLNLEFAGIVKSLPGKVYQLV